MRYSVWAILVGAALLLFSCPVAMAIGQVPGNDQIVSHAELTSQTAGSSIAPTDIVIEKLVFKKINAIRVTHGRTKLRWSDTLYDAAVAHSMNSLALCSNSGDSTHFNQPWNCVYRLVYPKGRGEDVGYIFIGGDYENFCNVDHEIGGTVTDQANGIIHMFMKHDGCKGNVDKDNILKKSYRRVGVGISSGTYRFVTIDFA